MLYMEELVKIPVIPLKTSLRTHVLYEQILIKLLEEFRKIPNITALRFQNSFTEMVCTAVEHCIKSNKKDKVDKKKLVISILTGLYNLTPAEQLLVGSQIEYMVEKDLILKIVKPIATKVYHKLLKYTVGKK